MRPLLSLLAVAGGVCLLYLGYERQNSLAGQAEGTLSGWSQKIDGRDHSPGYVRYYFAGAVVLAGGFLGFSLGRK
jgi:uncharacterized membrane protein (UPF0136 family)